MPGIYHITSVKRGDTFPAFPIATLTDAETGDPIAVTSAAMQVRKRATGDLVLEWSTADATITITGSSNVITLAEKSDEVMAELPPGTHDYDLEVVLTDGTRKLTLLEGDFPITADITHS